MRLIARLLIAAVVATVPAGVALTSCGTSSVGIDACRQIETARCYAAPVCVAGFNVGACAQYYHDECLVGIENESDASDPPIATVTSCVTEINALAACIDAGVSLESCNLQLMTDAGLECGDAGLDAGPPTACELLTVCPELLTQCNFVATPLAVNGTACSTAAACASGNCVDSICCAAATCTGTCLTGTCSTGTCDLQPPNFVCAGGTCTGAGNNSVSGLGVCDGTTATCHTQPDIVCASGTCVSTGCSSCTLDGQCSKYGWCSANACTAQGLTGATCSANDQCTTTCNLANQKCN